ncbi:HAD family hydrolase [Bacillus suaedaesalsae]|uniref:HAD family phosphatase n=1 Tax=Bacillus suaedaesalsae TaxID=2810349 RepID=A0ABS2DEV9_9BACI|nr:HAD family hydrolase [Bacillus suaedaesalsae]MBM6617003.1 HAD family phosphatase [Bacillus suaedaesalsae]
MSEYKIVFLDIDGTILRPDHTIESSTKSAISQLQAKGIEVILATGRPLHEIDELAKELSITSFIAYNGAYGIYKNEDIVKETMNDYDVKRFLQIAEENDHTLVFYTNKMNAFTSMEPPIVKTFINTFDLRKNTLFDPSLNNDVLGLTIITKEENAYTYYEEFEEIHYTTVNVSGLTTCLDVIRDRVNKGMAVEALIKKLGIPKESTIAFGDGMNDKEMLSTVGEGFAMGNAHHELFQYAKHKTTDVEHSGIFNGLKRLGLVE